LARPSIFDRETFPDFIDPPVQRIESGVEGPVVKVKYVAAGQKSENPVVRLHIDQYLLDRVTDRNNNVPQGVHRILPSRENDFLIVEGWC
jgi:hypothetical protein